VYRLYLILFHLIVYYNITGMPCIKTTTKIFYFSVFNFLLWFSQVDKSNLLMTNFFDDGDLTRV